MTKLKDETELGSIFGERVSVQKVNGRLVITNRPKKKRGEPTAKEIAHRARVSEAATYAKNIGENEELRALYATRVRKKHESPQSVAIRDFLNPPKVDLIKANKYLGVIGDIIDVHATDDFQVIKVTITITDAEGVVIEEGDAMDGRSERINQWEYKAVAANPTLKGTKIVAVAYDRPGNKGAREVVL